MKIVFNFLVPTIHGLPEKEPFSEMESHLKKIHMYLLSAVLK